MKQQAIAFDQLLGVLNSANQGIMVHDRQGTFVFTNPAASALLGGHVPDAADSYFDAVDENERPLAPEQYPGMVALRTKSRVTNFVMGIATPHLAERRWFLVDSCPLYVPGEDEPNLAYGIFTDITEKMHAERDLRQSKRHLALAQRITEVGSAAVDFRTGKWDWSDETFRIYGVDPESFVPSADALGGLVHPEDWPSLYANVPRAQKGGEPEPVVEYRITRPDGAERIVRRIATSVRDEDGNITGIVATVQDVTELRMAQRENKALQSQLYHAQKLDSLGTLAGGIAHDLNNTLVPVLALSDSLLAQTAEDDPNRPLLELVRQGGQRASDLVAQILTFARRDVVEHEVFDVRTFLEEFALLIRASISKRIKIVQNLEAMAKVRGSQGQLHQVILNLFSNAAQAIGDKAGHIYLSTAMVEGMEPGGGASRPFIQISVADTGAGMSEEVKARIFEPFYTTKEVGGGLGLGLSVVHGIVASHGGHIHVTSAPGQGTRMDVLIPAAGD